MATPEPFKGLFGMGQMLLGSAECDRDRRLDPHEIGYVQHERLPRILVDEAELWNRAGASHRNCRRALDRTGGVIDGLVRHVAVARVAAIVAATAPCDADSRGYQLVAFFHTGAFDAAQHVEISSREYLFETPGIHPAGDRKPDLGVSPGPRLPTRQLRCVRQKGRSGVKPHAVLSNCRKPSIVAS